MIKVDRYKIPYPKILRSEEIERLKARTEEFYARPENERSQKRFPRLFDSSVARPLKDDLAQLFNGKCAYCESKISQATGTGDLDHFRPKSGARDLQRGFSPDHYWWLVYEWENMYYSCRECNKHKASWFPIKTERVKPKTFYPAIWDIEKPLFVDPCNNEPSEHFSYDNDGTITPLSEEGETTIKIIQLNRVELVRERLEAIQFEFGEWEAITRNWRNDRSRVNEILSDWNNILDGSSSKSYLGIRRHIILDRLQTRTDIAEALNSIADFKSEEFNLSKEEEVKSRAEIISPLELVERYSAPDEPYVSNIDLSEIRSIQLDRIELKNYKCFENLTIDFKHNTKGDDDLKLSREPWLTFLGENGVGKSSILKAIALCLVGKTYLPKLKQTPDSLIKHRKQKGFIKLYLKGEEHPIEIHFKRGEKKITTINLKPPTYLLGYGSTRLLPDSVVKTEQRVELVKSKNLFQPSVALIDAREWLISQDQKEFDRAAISLKDLLNLPQGDRLIKKKKEIYVENESGENSKISDLSDGYKSVLALAVDIMATLQRENLTYDLAEGIVLIDEIGTHLHPRWKMNVVQRLRETFPKMQFVVTTHDPLCLRGLEKGEIVVLNKVETEIVHFSDLPDPSVLRIDQILTSPLFGLNSIIDPETEALFDEYYKLLSKSTELNDKELRRKAQLSDLIPKIKQLGDSPREELATYIIDEMLAKNARSTSPDSLKNLKPKVKERVIDIWKTLPDD